jgi:hypothetical protein
LQLSCKFFLKATTYGVRMTAVPQLVGETRLIWKNRVFSTLGNFFRFPVCFSLSETAGVVVQKPNYLRP